VTYVPRQDLPMFAHQRETWESTRHLKAWGLLFEQRCGKSRVLLDTAGWLYDQGFIKGLLIIAPKEVCRTWEQEQLPKFLTLNSEVLRWRGLGTRDRRRRVEDICSPGTRLKVFIINVEAFSGAGGGAIVKICRHFMKSHQTLLTVDESSTIKERTSKRTERVLALASLAPFRRILTGTPVTQTPLDCFTQIGFLDTKVFGTNWFAFRARYAVIEDVYTQIRGERKTVKVVKGYRNLEELTEKLVSISTRVLRKDCFDLPPKLFQKIDVEIPDDLRRIYDMMAKREVLALEAEGIVTPALALARSMSLRQLTSEFLLQKDEVSGDTNKLEFGRSRLDALIHAVKECSGKVVVWTVFQHSQGRIIDTLMDSGVPVVSLVGGDSDAQREEALRLFRSDEVNVIVVNQRIGQFGLDLSAADWSICYEHDWSVERRVQLEDRTQHPSRTKSVGYLDLVMPGTIDDVILTAVKNGRNLADVVAGFGWKTIFKEIDNDQL